MFESDLKFMQLALRLAKRAYGQTSPNPMVGAVLVKRGRVIGQSWHHRAGQPHAEIEALRDAARRGNKPSGATLYVTLEPCCTHGRTPPCTDAIITAGIKRVVIGATDPNPNHVGKGLRILERAGISVELFGVPRLRGTSSLWKGDRLKAELQTLNEAFNHWIVHGTPFVTVKAAMTLDGKIATARGESKWITGEPARAYGMKLRQGADAILVGANTILADDPSLTVRPVQSSKSQVQSSRLRRVVLDTRARTPLNAKVVLDGSAALTTIVVGRSAPKRRVEALARRVRVLVAPERKGKINLRWLLRRLGREEVTSLLVEGGGEVNASFLEQGLTQRVVFFYAPKILGGRDARRGVAGDGAASWADVIPLEEVKWRRLGVDLLMTARVGKRGDDKPRTDNPT